jgi:hypothetical protein
MLDLHRVERTTVRINADEEVMLFLKVVETEMGHCVDFLYLRERTAIDWQITDWRRRFKVSSGFRSRPRHRSSMANAIFNLKRTRCRRVN